MVSRLPFRMVLALALILGMTPSLAILSAG
jgi:hypothetical protein